ncbi:hypothetical protein PIB30_105293, partial [Stylosanthes scabra]|nr:hypothetical protein [Stylosanthes scabra]
HTTYKSVNPKPTKTYLALKLQFSAMENSDGTAAGSVGRTMGKTPSSTFPTWRQCNVGEAGSPVGLRNDVRRP